MSRETAAFVAGSEESGRTVAAALHDRVGLSHATAKGLIASGAVLVNGVPATKPDTRLADGDRVETSWETGRRYRAPRAGVRRESGYTVVHEDADLVVTDKAAGILTIPAGVGGALADGTSLLERLQALYKKRGFRDTHLSAVHRIDRFTSGLVVFSRRETARSFLRSQFAANRPERVYLAVCEGVLAVSRGRLEHDLVEHPKTLKVSAVSGGGAGRRATLRYEVLERFPAATLVEVRLETGRRNQIRVQFAHEGHPLVGDVSYGKPSPLIPRAALHAHRLSFLAPSGRMLEFTSEPPEDFRRLLRLLRRGGDDQSPTRSSTPV